jgi:hypothetical protein
MRRFYLFATALLVASAAAAIPSILQPNFKAGSLPGRHLRVGATAGKTHCWSVSRPWHGERRVLAAVTDCDRRSRQRSDVRGFALSKIADEE